MNATNDNNNENTSAELSGEGSIGKGAVIPTTFEVENNELKAEIATLKADKATLQADNEAMAAELQAIANAPIEAGPVVLLVGSAEMVNIQKTFVEYGVKFDEGHIAMRGLDRIRFDRAEFPVDDDFSADFMDRELVAPEEVAEPDPDRGTPRERGLYEEYELQLTAFNKTVAKQTAFRNMRTLTIQITESE